MKYFTAWMLALVACGSFAMAEESSDKTSDEALVRAAEKLVYEGNATLIDPVETGKSTDPAQSAQISESEIPVVLGKSKNATSETPLAWRLIVSLAIIAIVGGGALFFARRNRHKKDLGGKSARIEMLHQMHLGPKKSLALIRVAGEVALVGITDHNINMIKPVMLIDDGVEAAVNGTFNNFLEDDFSVQDVRSAIGARV